jgi:hypothetical protein
MSAGLNDSPKFISALGQLVMTALGETIHSNSSIYSHGASVARVVDGSSRLDKVI